MMSPSDVMGFHGLVLSSGRLGCPKAISKEWEKEDPDKAGACLIHHRYAKMLGSVGGGGETVAGVNRMNLNDCMMFLHDNLIPGLSVTVEEIISKLSI